MDTGTPERNTRREHPATLLPFLSLLPWLKEGTLPFLFVLTLRTAAILLSGEMAYLRRLTPQLMCTALYSLQNPFLCGTQHAFENPRLGGRCVPGKLKRRAWPRSVTEALMLAPKEVTVCRAP